MATPRATSNRPKAAALAAAGLVLIGAWVGWRIVERPSVPTTIVTQPREQSFAPPSRATGEPARPAIAEVRGEPSANAAAGRTSTVAGEPDGRDQERLAFVRRLNTADARSLLGPGIPLAISELVGAGRLRDAADELLQMGRDGDANGYAALEQLLRNCPGPGDDRAFEGRALDRKARNQQMINRMASAGASESLLERLQWSLDGGNAFFRGIWAEFCPSRDAGDYQTLLEEVHRVLPRPTPWKHEAQLRAEASGGPRAPSSVRDAHRREVTEHTRRRAEAGVIASQLQLARRDVYGGDAAQKAAAFAVLRSLASVSPEARAELARRCAKGRCPPEAGTENALQLALNAARGGSVEAFEMLDSKIFGLVEDAAERYAWSQVRHELHEQGCFGFSRFSNWAFRHALRREAALLDMSPREAEVAKRRAAEMIATEVPGMRARLGCD